MTTELDVDVISDVVCPWCFIGKRKLERAIESWQADHNGGHPVRVRWHAYQLNPDFPPEGLARAEFLRRKFGTQDVGQRFERVRAAGAAVGIPFAFERIERIPNTLPAHALIALAAERGCQEETVEAFFRAYFLDGEDLCDQTKLVDIAEGAGLDRVAAETWLSGSAARSAVAAADQHARKMGVQGVPFFIFNRRIAVSGAQDPAVLLEAMREAAAERA